MGRKMCIIKSHYGKNKLQVFWYEVDGGDTYAENETFARLYLSPSNPSPMATLPIQAIEKVTKELVTVEDGQAFMLVDSGYPVYAEAKA